MKIFISNDGENWHDITGQVKHFNCRCHLAIDPFIPQRPKLQGAVFALGRKLDGKRAGKLTLVKSKKYASWRNEYIGGNN